MKTKFLIAAVLSSMLLTACGDENKTVDASNNASSGAVTEDVSRAAVSETNANGVRDDVEAMIKSVHKEGYYEPAMKLARALQATLDTTSTDPAELEALNINYSASITCLHRAVEFGPNPFENGFVTSIIDKTLDTGERIDKHREFLISAPNQENGISMDDIVCS